MLPLGGFFRRVDGDPSRLARPRVCAHRRAWGRTPRAKGWEATSRSGKSGQKARPPKALVLVLSFGRSFSATEMRAPRGRERGRVTPTAPVAERRSVWHVRDGKRRRWWVGVVCRRERLPRSPRAPTSKQFQRSDSSARLDNKKRGDTEKQRSCFLCGVGCLCSFFVSTASECSRMLLCGGVSPQRPLLPPLGEREGGNNAEQTSESAQTV